MKLYIDTDKKLIEIDEEIQLGEFIEQLEKFVGEDWKNYKIQSRYKHNFIPITIPDTNPNTYPFSPQITYKGNIK